MQITSLNNSYNNIRNINNNISFSSIERSVYDIDNCRLQYRNNTCLFRRDLNWKMLAKHIKEKKVPQKIYCYGCSDGSEAYSIALILINELGYEEAQKYFPIIAKDIDETMIERAKKGVISLEYSDFANLSLLKNLKKDDYLKKTAYKDYATKSYQGYNDFYRINENLYKCVKFEKGNIISDLPIIEYDNAMIFFRNALPYLSDDDKKLLIKYFKKKFQPTTSFVVGSFDRGFWAEINDSRSAFDDYLFEGNLWQVKPCIYEKHNLTDNPFNPNNWRKILKNNFSMFIINVVEMFNF